MFGRSYHLIGVLAFFALFCATISCKNKTASAGKKIENSDSANDKKIKPVFKKPPSTFQDTLKIHGEAAVFYSPDSLQLERIKQQSDNAALASSEHEYFYMMRNARIVIKKTWPALKITDSKHYRYLLFIKNDGSKECIDLDKYDDMYGLFVFDGKKSPMLVDAMNIDTEVSFYLKNRQ
jgi:hypothetical protein